MNIDFRRASVAFLPPARYLIESTHTSGKFSPNNTVVTPRTLGASIFFQINEPLNTPVIKVLNS